MDRKTNAIETLDRLADPDWGLDTLWGLVLDMNNILQGIAVHLDVSVEDLASLASPSPVAA